MVRFSLHRKISFKTFRRVQDERRRLGWVFAIFRFWQAYIYTRQGSKFVTKIIIIMVTWLSYMACILCVSKSPLYADIFFNFIADISFILSSLSVYEISE